jgi:hypothetical protein
LTSLDPKEGLTLDLVENDWIVKLDETARQRGEHVDSAIVATIPGTEAGFFFMMHPFSVTP